MKISLKSKDLVKIRRELKKAMEVYGEQQKALVELDKNHKKQAFKIDRIKEKGLKILDKLLKEQHKMEEFDYFVNYEATDDETIECQIQNLFEDAFGDPEGTKKRLRAERKTKTGMWVDKTMFTGHV